MATQQSMDLLATLKANIAANYDSDSDSGNRSFDEEYYFLKPPPLDFEVGESCITKFERLIKQRTVALNCSNLNYSNAIKNSNTQNGIGRKNVWKKGKTKHQMSNLYLQSINKDHCAVKTNDVIPINDAIDINNVIEFPTLGSKKRNKKGKTILDISDSHNKFIDTSHNIETYVLDNNNADVNQDDHTKGLNTANISIVNAKISKTEINNCDKYCKTNLEEAYEPKNISKSNKSTKGCSENDYDLIQLVLKDDTNLLNNTIKNGSDKCVNTKDAQNNIFVEKNVITCNEIDRDNDCFIEIKKKKIKQSYNSSANINETKTNNNILQIKQNYNRSANIDETKTNNNILQIKQNYNRSANINKTKTNNNILLKNVKLDYNQSESNDLKINEYSNMLAKKNNKPKLDNVANKKSNNIIKLQTNRTRKSNVSKQNHTKQTTNLKRKLPANTTSKKQIRNGNHHQTSTKNVQNPVLTSTLFTNPNMALYKLLLNNRITCAEIETLLSDHFGNRYIVLSCKRSTFYANKICRYFDIHTKAVAMSVLSDGKLSGNNDLIHAIDKKPRKLQVRSGILTRKHKGKTKRKIKNKPWMDMIMEKVARKFIIYIASFLAIRFLFEVLLILVDWYNGYIIQDVVWNFTYIIIFIPIFGMYFIDKWQKSNRPGDIMKRKLF